MTNEGKFDIYDRAFEFAVRAAKFVEGLPKTPAALEYGKQLIKASGSIGANIAEADGTLTKKDFVNKIGISRRESRESRHWLCLISRVVDVSDNRKKELNWQIDEAGQLMLILSSIIKKTKDK